MGGVSDKGVDMQGESQLLINFFLAETTNGREQRNNKFKQLYLRVSRQWKNDISQQQVYEVGIRSVPTTTRVVSIDDNKTTKMSNKILSISNSETSINDKTTKVR